MYAQIKLTKSYRIRLSDEDLQLLNNLKKLRIKPTTFLRNVFREKIQRELPKLIETENKRKEKIKCPF
jgi:hypothetical protein